MGAGCRLYSSLRQTILSKVDYCNVVLAGLPTRDLDRLQSVINAAACLTTGARYAAAERLTLVACT